MAHAAPVVRRPMPEGVAAVTVAVAAGAAAAIATPLLVAAVLVVQLGAVAGVLLLGDAPAFRDSMVIAGVAAVSADVLVIAEDGAGVGPMVGVFALALIGAILAELMRSDRERVTQSLAATVAAVALVVLTAHLLVLHAPQDGDLLVGAALACVAVSLVVGRLVDVVVPHPRVAPGGTRGAAGVAAAVASGATTGATFGLALPPLSPGSGVLLGVAVAAAAATADVATDLAAADLVARRALAAPLAAVLPVVLAAPVAYGVARLAIG